MYRIFSIFHVKKSGFTLVEFIIIISIFTIMAGILSFNFNGFRNSAGLNNLTHDLALSIYSIQKKALSGLSSETVRVSGTTSITDALPYGIAFKKSLTGTGFDSEFILFRDDSRNGEYDAFASTDRIIDTVKIQTADTVSAIDTYNGSTYAPVSTVSGSYFSITFERPWPEVKNMPFGASAIRITLASADGTKKYISISAIGQISLQ